MSEKQQHTAASMRDKMIRRYGDGHHHKHDKLHIPYRLHCRSHPAHFINEPGLAMDGSLFSGQLRAFKLRRLRKRLDKGRIH